MSLPNEAPINNLPADIEAEAVVNGKRQLQKSRVTKATRANLKFQPRRVHNLSRRVLRGGQTSDRGLIELTKGIQEIATMILNASIEVAKGGKRQRIQPKHIHRGIQNNAELMRVFQGFTFAGTDRSQLDAY